VPASCEGYRFAEFIRRIPPFALGGPSLNFNRIKTSYGTGDDWDGALGEDERHWSEHEDESSLLPSQKHCFRLYDRCIAFR